MAVYISLISLFYTRQEHASDVRPNLQLPLKTGIRTISSFGPLFGSVGIRGPIHPKTLGERERRYMGRVRMASE